MYNMFDLSDIFILCYNDLEQGKNNYPHILELFMETL